MRKKKVWRYYCDFCGKGGCNGGHTKEHELHCTLNPERVCGVCQASGQKQQPINVLMNAYEESLEKLKDVAEGCPTCMLAGIRQWKKNRAEYPDERWDDWDYKKALADFWHEVNHGGI